MKFQLESKTPCQTKISFTIEQNQSKFKVIYVGFINKKHVDMHLLHQIENIYLLRCKIL